ncbi:MAG TPA: cytochrome P450 [Terriglobales bacterium]|nr:cytochrome P450 [Terriglobales bacterium]
MNSSTNILSREFKADPFPFYALMRAEQPVCCVTVPGMGKAWLITRYDDVVAVLKDNRFAKNPLNASTQPWLPGFAKPLQRNMLDLDEPDHARLRTLVHKAFTPSMVERLQDRIQGIADHLIDAVAPTGAMDLVRAYALPLPLTVIAELLGIPGQDRDRFHRWSKALVKTPTKLNMVVALPSLMAFMRYLRRLFRQLRRAPQDGLLTALVQVEEAGDRLSEDELLAMAFLLLIAGHETTVNLISSGTLALLQHPDELERLRADPSLIKPAVEELLRYTNPLETATPRYAREDTTVGDVLIPRGALVLAAVASANRDAAQFDDPDRLDISRQQNRHLAFGLGAHFCLGAPLARLEGQIAINTIVRRLPHLQLAVPAESLRWRATPVLRGLEALPVRW